MRFSTGSPHRLKRPLSRSSRHASRRAWRMGLLFAEIGTARFVAAGNFVISAICPPTDTVSLDRSTLNIAGRNGFSGNLLHEIPDGRTAI